MLLLFFIIGAAAGAGIGWWVEQQKGGPQNRNMEAGPIHKIMQKGGGAFLTVAAFVAAFSTHMTASFAFGFILLGAYVVYLLWPGYRGFLFFI
ncbi:MAG: hypothetical protein PUK59_00625 [Actinomycetaceae bacterium]|nr:hypothetical protein [Actinomycetaceae bacterium]MDY5854578.1 hypothetical protein [Arcanobacterium sp.]